MLNVELSNMNIPTFLISCKKFNLLILLELDCLVNFLNYKNLLFCIPIMFYTYEFYILES